MTLLIFLALNLLLMVGLFLVGVYLFLQVEDKRKRNKLRLLDSSVDMSELREMLRAERHDEALQRLMQADDIGRASFPGRRLPVPPSSSTSRKHIGEDKRKRNKLRLLDVQRGIMSELREKPCYGSAELSRRSVATIVVVQLDASRRHCEETLLARRNVSVKTSAHGGKRHRDADAAGIAR